MKLPFGSGITIETMSEDDAHIENHLKRSNSWSGFITVKEQTKPSKNEGPGHRWLYYPYVEGTEDQLTELNVYVGNKDFPNKTDNGYTWYKVCFEKGRFLKARQSIERFLGGDIENTVTGLR